MKQLIIIILFSCIAFISDAQNKSNSLETHMTNCVFNDEAAGSYVETYFSINPHSLFYKKQADSTFQASLVVTIIFKKDGNEIVHFDKYQLNTANYKNANDIKNINSALVDLRRNALPKGNYTVETEIVNENRKAVLTDSTIKIGFDAAKFSFSNIELLDTFYEGKNKTSFQRGDLQLIPMVLNYFPSQKNKLNFYTEIYPPANQKDLKFILQYAISRKETGKTLDEFSNSEVLDNADVVPVLESIDISKLASGNYTLNLQLLNRSNEIYAATNIPFQRFKSLSHKMNNSSDTAYFSKETNFSRTFVNRYSKEEMKTRLRTIFPIASTNEGRYIDNLVQENNEEHMKQFYYNFWQKRNSFNPLAAFNEYEEQLKIVNSNYGTAMRFGFETDRGRVYLQYGAPNSIEHSADGGNTGMPYEVWDYYALDEQKNVQFVFSPKDRSTNDFEIVYTNKTGEKNNNWSSNNGTQSAMPNYDGVNPNTFGNTLGRDMNTPIDGGQQSQPSINTFMNNPK